VDREEFDDDLRRILGRQVVDATVRNALWNAVLESRTDEKESSRFYADVDRMCREARAQARAAAEIEGAARKLIASLERAKRTAGFVAMVRAVKLDAPNTFRVRTLADLQGKPAWQTGSDAQTVVEALSVEAKILLKLAASRGRRPRGRRRDRRRLLLAEWVAIQLSRHGIPTSRSGHGLFGRILKLMHFAAGWPERDVERDVRSALDSESVRPYLANRQRSLRPATQFR
jgi:hypothetical protein